MSCDEPGPQHWLANTWDDALEVVDRFPDDECRVTGRGHYKVDPDTIPDRREP